MARNDTPPSDTEEAPADGSTTVILRLWSPSHFKKLLFVGVLPGVSRRLPSLDSLFLLSIFPQTAMR